MRLSVALSWFSSAFRTIKERWNTRQEKNRVVARATWRKERFAEMLENAKKGMFSGTTNDKGIYYLYKIEVAGGICMYAGPAIDYCENREILFRGRHCVVESMTWKKVYNSPKKIISPWSFAEYPYVEVLIRQKYDDAHRYIDYGTSMGKPDVLLRNKSSNTDKLYKFFALRYFGTK